MRHFVAYHKADDRGPLDRTEQDDIVAIGSTKSMKTLQAAIGNRVWLFEGRGTKAGKSVFSLAYSFVADTAEDAANGEERGLSGSSVVHFEAEALNDYPWFRALKNEVANFSLGFREVKSPVVIAQLEAYLVGVNEADLDEQPPVMYTEGRKRRVAISIRERSAPARRACIRHHGAVCIVCGFEFGLFYGKLAEGFIEVHHRRQISKSNGARSLDAVSDLVPLCANCHRVVHLSNPPMDVEVLKGQIAKVARQ